MGNDTELNGSHCHKTKNPKLKGDKSMTTFNKKQAEKIVNTISFDTDHVSKEEIIESMIFARVKYQKKNREIYKDKLTVGKVWFYVSMDETDNKKKSALRVKLFGNIFDAQIVSDMRKIHCLMNHEADGLEKTNLKLTVTDSEGNEVDFTEFKNVYCPNLFSETALLTKWRNLCKGALILKADTHEIVKPEKEDSADDSDSDNEETLTDEEIKKESNIIEMSINALELIVKKSEESDNAFKDCKADRIRLLNQLIADCQAIIEPVYDSMNPETDKQAVNA